MVKDHSDCERGNPMVPIHGLLFQLAARIIHTTTMTKAMVYSSLHGWCI